MYGLDRLKTIVRNEGHRSARELVDIIVTDVDKFKGDAEQSDDLTLLVTKAL
jgi:serine phosphatase RsbU (regulator of sigma subunit)